MRSVSGKSITKKQEVDVVKVITTEEICTIVEYKYHHLIEVEVALKTSDQEIVQTEKYRIEGEMFDLLMSSSPYFAPGKPENEYREVDVWFIIDRLRS